MDEFGEVDDKGWRGSGEPLAGRWPPHRDRPRHPRPGHIPGSVNVPFRSLITPDGGAADAQDIRGRYEDIEALDDDKTPITYCGSGIAATFEAFQLARLGRPGVAVYDGSLTEWAADDSLPLNVTK